MMVRSHFLFQSNIKSLPPSFVMFFPTWHEEMKRIRKERIEKVYLSSIIFKLAPLKWQCFWRKSKKPFETAVKKEKKILNDIFPVDFSSRIHPKQRINELVTIILGWYGLYSLNQCVQQRTKNHTSTFEALLVEYRESNFDFKTSAFFIATASWNIYK